VRRHDLLAQMAAQAACCLYWFHPLVWLAVRQLRKERETACDDAVLSIGVPAPDYAGHLLDMARTLVARRSLADAPAMAEAGDLEDRVRAVLDGGRNRTPLNRRLAATVATLACALVLPVALVTLRAQAPTGGLSGIVMDSSQARVPGTAIQIKNLNGQNEEIGTVNAAGEFGFPAIPPGSRAPLARPVSVGFEPGASLEGVQSLVHSHHTLSALLAAPARSDSPRASRRCQGCLPSFPAAPGSDCPQLHRAAATARRRGLAPRTNR
jgi:hypothetical protein